MQSTKGYHKLIIAQKLREFIIEIYEITESFPNSEMFGLTSQLRRATTSVLLNIVEGQRRQSTKEFLHFLDIADASLAEVEVCLEISSDLTYITNSDYETIENKRKEIAYMLVAFIKTIKKSL